MAGEPRSSLQNTRIRRHGSQPRKYVGSKGSHTLKSATKGQRQSLGCVRLLSSELGEMLQLSGMTRCVACVTVRVSVVAGSENLLGKC